MGKKILFGILGFFAGLVVAFLLIVLVEMFSEAIYPLPAEAKGSHEAICEHVAKYPQWILGVVTVVWGATTFLSTWLASRIGGRISGILLGLLLLAALGFNLSMLPYAPWFEMATLASFPVCILAGVFLATLRKSPSSPLKDAGATVKKTN